MVPPPEPTLGERLATARSQLHDLEDDYRALHGGTGRWRHTPEGEAARNLADASDRLDATRRAAQDPSARHRERRVAAKAIPELESAFADAEQRWQAVGEPAAAGIGHAIGDALQAVTRIEAEMLTERLDHLQRPSPEGSLGQALGLSL